MYGAAIALGVLGMLAWVTLAPSPTVSYRVDGQQVVVEAHGGLGYRYQWDLEGDGTFDAETPERRQTARCTPSEQPDGTRLCRVGLRVRNAFGYRGTTVRTIELPRTEPQMEVGH